MDGPSAINRLGTYGVPAIASECVHEFFSAIMMDSLKLNNMVAVDQLHTLLSDLSALLDKLGTLPPDIKAKTVMKEWISTFKVVEHGGSSMTWNLRIVHLWQLCLLLVLGTWK